MYLAVVAMIVGQALVLAQPALLGYAAAVGAMVAFVHGYEEPTLDRQFSEQYQAYRRAVPAWWPLLRPIGNASGVSRPTQRTCGRARSRSW